MLALPYTARKCECYQLCMRAISRSKHTKLKNYSKGVLINHTKLASIKFPAIIWYMHRIVTITMNGMCVRGSALSQDAGSANLENKNKA